MRKRLVTLFLLALSTSGCATVEPWQRGRLSMEAMMLSDDLSQAMERSIEVYREGAVGANGGKAGGGCGCT